MFNLFLSFCKKSGNPSIIPNQAWVQLMCCIFTLAACNPKAAENEKIRIATAANMQFVMDTLTKKFTERTAISCELIISASGKLTAQIIEGAPYDVFVAANMKYPNEIFKNGLAGAPPKVYAYGKMVLWTMVDGIDPTLEALTNEYVRHIALANPKTAPYGVAAIEILKHYQIFDRLESKLVYGESIAQTNQFITSRSAELGFTAMSVVLSPGMKGKGKWKELDRTVYSPIEQGVVTIRRGENRDAHAKEFFEFLFSDDAKSILENFGYTVDE